jgi:hypothetical protein
MRNGQRSWDLNEGLTLREKARRLVLRLLERPVAPLPHAAAATG